MRNSRSSLLRDRIDGFREARLIIIAAEGACTEKIYFETLAKEYADTGVHVRVLERSEEEKHNSSPERVYSQILDFKNQYSLEADDELWLVIDRDRWAEKSLSDIAADCSKDSIIHMALSNPCIELWLLLHLIDPATLSSEEISLWKENKKVRKNSDTYLKIKLRTLMGSYQECSYDTSLLLLNVDSAISRAKVLDVKPNDRWPQSLGTRVYLLAESILNRNH